MIEGRQRRAPESLLAKLSEAEQARLRVYIGAAPGVGKTYQMLEDAHLMKKQGVDIVVAVVETHGREDTKAMIGDLECVPMHRIEYRGVTIEEMDVDAVVVEPLLEVGERGVGVVDEVRHVVAERRHLVGDRVGQDHAGQHERPDQAEHDDHDRQPARDVRLPQDRDERVQQQRHERADDEEQQDGPGGPQHRPQEEDGQREHDQLDPPGDDHALVRHRESMVTAVDVHPVHR